MEWIPGDPVQPIGRLTNNLCRMDDCCVQSPESLRLPRVDQWKACQFHSQDGRLHEPRRLKETTRSESHLADRTHCRTNLRFESLTNQVVIIRCDFDVRA